VRKTLILSHQGGKNFINVIRCAVSENLPQWLKFDAG
jgi:hypothetical protein